jgi:hypothetical protein
MPRITRPERAAMARIALAVLLFGLLATRADAAGAPPACTALTETEALALVGAPLGAVTREEVKPTAENGHDATNACGYFPKGYDLAKADGPPERGIMVTLHSMPDGDAAKRFYNQMFKMAGMSVANQPGVSIAPVTGLGEGAYLQLMTLDSKPPVRLANVGFYKGSVMGFIQVWIKGPPGEVAQKAAKGIISKLP